MPGFPLTVKKNRAHSIARSHQIKLLLISVIVGAAAGLFIAKVRLGLGLPGHKIFFWMTPALIVRLRGKCRFGTAGGGISAALTASAFGGNLAGGLTGLPAVALGAAIVDLSVDYLETNKTSALEMILLIGLAGIVANLVCLTGRMLLPAGLGPHFFFGLSTSWFRLFSYMFFGFASGVAATAISRLGRPIKGATPDGR